MPKFTVLLDNQPLKTYEVTDTVITIGRLPENTIPIVNMGMSRRHSRIERDSEGNWVVSDLNSLNGTFVNNAKVTRTILADGDRIIVGQHTILFELDSPHDLLTPQMQQPIEETESRNATASFVDKIDISQSQDTPILKMSKSIITDGPQAITRLDSEDDRAFSESGDVAPLTESARALPKGTPVFIETTKHVVYKLDKEIISIGNADTDDIFVDGLFIDTGHVTVEKRDDGMYLVTKKLLGTVKVNGKKARIHPMQHKDRIEIGSSTFRYMENE